jgi:hypothetical protein
MKQVLVLPALYSNKPKDCFKMVVRILMVDEEKVKIGGAIITYGDPNFI